MRFYVDNGFGRTDSFHKIACGHDQHVFAMFKLVQLSKEGINDLGSTLFNQLS